MSSDIACFSSNMSRMSHTRGMCKLVLCKEKQANTIRLRTLTGKCYTIRFNLLPCSTLIQLLSKPYP